MIKDGNGTASTLMALFSQFGMNPGDALYRYLGLIFYKYLGNADVTFRQLYDAFGVELAISVTNVTRYLPAWIEPHHPWSLPLGRSPSLVSDPDLAARARCCSTSRPRPTTRFGRRCACPCRCRSSSGHARRSTSMGSCTTSMLRRASTPSAYVPAHRTPDTTMGSDCRDVDGSAFALTRCR
jgi:hypothetical protein